MSLGAGRVGPSAVQTAEGKTTGGRAVRGAGTEGHGGKGGGAGGEINQVRETKGKN